MFQQPLDFRDESEALYQVLATLSDADFERPTQFKAWTINDVVSHLHAWNIAADLALADAAAFDELRTKLFEGIARGPDGGPKFPVQLDLQLFAFATLLATGVGLLSAVIPARRASKLDPATAIRNG